MGQEIVSENIETVDSTFLKPYKKSKSPVFRPEDRYGDPLSFPGSKSPMQLKDPASMKLEYELDTANNYTIDESIDGLRYRPQTGFTFEEYNRLQQQQMLRNYWKDRSKGADGESAVSGRRLIPPIFISPVFDRIFGGTFVDIQPSGYVNMKFGGSWQRTYNPSVPVAQQSSGGFDFDMQMGMNLVGKIGEKLQITANFDKNNSFSFENDLKVEYTGFDEEIIKKIEVGNVSMGVGNSLIRGAQNLFGIKTQLQFGKLFVTTVLTTQRGKSESISIGANGSPGQGSPILQSGVEYDENRHFFLGHFFRNKYEEWLKSRPQTTSGVNVTRVEVFVINNNNQTTGLRSVAAFMDLGEGDQTNMKSQILNPVGGTNSIANNGSNRLFEDLTTSGGALFRNSDNFDTNIKSQFTDFEPSLDYLKLQGARKLKPEEFYFNKSLGYLSLKRPLQNSEMLAVSYEYTYRGKRYQVGELSEDYSSLGEKDLVFLKLLRPNKINTTVPSWDLMMKNIYRLQSAGQIKKEGFELKIIYRDDRTGLDNPTLSEGANLKDKPIVNVLGLDNLNVNNDYVPQGDGNFDYIEGITINPEYGLIIFPILEPFGKNLKELFVSPTEDQLAQKYVFEDLYSKTLADARNDANKNKFFLSGKVQSSAGNEIALPGINIAENSVTVTAGGTPLTEGLDYRVDYTLGRVTILNEGILSSGKEIKVNYEKADLFNFQSRTLLGTRFDYRFNDNFNIGATAIYLNERPIVSRVAIGSEPLRNFKYGLDVNYQSDSRFLTRMVDALPIVSTKEPSSIQVSAEFAQLLPGSSNKVNGTNTAYIDDFETSVTPYNIGSVNYWHHAATPKTDDKKFTKDETISEGLGFNFKKAKLSWYIIDNLFYRTSSNNKPSNISKEDLENHYVRAISPQEIFKSRDKDVINNNLPTFNVAYFPEERGIQNYNPDLTTDGLLKNPEQNWGGITTPINGEVDFDKNNIEYIEFWMMDPFIDGENGKVLDGRLNTNNTTGGKLVFNLGNVSEDLHNNNKHAFENGLPLNGEDRTGITDMKPWGEVTTQPILNRAFSSDAGAREHQDVGFDGLSNIQEQAYFRTNFLNNISQVSVDARNKILEDPSADDFNYFLGDNYDQRDAKITERYKNFNGVEKNSPIVTSGDVSSSTQIPDNLDIDRDNTLSTLEEYYEYTLDLNKRDLQKGKKYVVDQVYDEDKKATWFLVRIPIRSPQKQYGNISGFKNIRFMRMFFTEFKQPVVLRMANFRFLGAQWRRYTGDLNKKGFDQLPEPAQDNDFHISAVNIEDNPSYVLPPGIERDRDNSSSVERKVNEQSMQLCVENLKNGDARAVYKNLSMNLLNYGRVKMYLHAESQDTQDDELSAFIRFGSDFTQNYYEVEIPLKISDDNNLDPENVWPEANNIDIALDEFYTLKKARNKDANASITLPYDRTVEIEGKKYRLTIIGRPEMSGVQTMMLGVRNPETTIKDTKTACLWFNELRVTDFNSTAGWAANARLNTKLADLATVSVSTNYISNGFGEIQQKLHERNRNESFSYDISSTINLDKLGPDRIGLKIPMFISYEENVTTPFYDPIDPDIPLEAALDAFDNDAERAEYKKQVQDRTTRRAINFTNVRKVKLKPEAKKHIYDIENFSFTYAFSEIKRASYNTHQYLNTNQRGSIGYNYSVSPVVFEPFKNIKFLDNDFTQLVKDFNFSFLPSSISIQADLDRRFVKTQLKGIKDGNLSIEGIDPTFEKYFYFNRNYNLRWALAKSLSLTYSARANAVIDEPAGDLDTQAKKDSVLNNLANFGRLNNFDQQLGLNYRLPLDKIPFLDWTNAEANYSVGYNWKAGAQNVQENFDFGNTIQNNRQISLSGKLDFTKLYNKSKYLKKVNAKPRRRSRSRRIASDSTVKELKGMKFGLRMLMMLKSVNATYSQTEGTLLPGFKNDIFLFGMDRNFSSPGLPFLLGSQSPDIKKKAATSGWLVQKEGMSTPFQQNKMVDININAKLQPIRDFKIQVNFKKQKSSNYQEIFSYNPIGNDDDDMAFSTQTPNRTGSYSITYLPIRTAFKKSELTSEVFEQFVENTKIIENRLDGIKGDSDAFTNKSQDVLIPAFLAAYSDQDASNVDFSPFPSIPLPNWRMDYTGLKKIPALKKIFSSITLSHAYSSTYTVSNFATSLEYTEDIDLDNNIEDYSIPTHRKDGANTGSFIPKYNIGQVSISERFQPLIGINIRTKSKINLKMEYRRERNLSLDMSNAQVSELNSKDVSFDLGYTKSGLKLPFKLRGKTIVLDNEISMRMNFTIRNTQTLQRRLEDIDVITNGNINYQFRPTVAYQVNDRLNMQLYFERSINEPKISTSYKRTNTSFGLQVRFSL